MTENRTHDRAPALARVGAIARRLAHAAAYAASVGATLLVWSALALELIARCGGVSARDLAGMPGSTRILDADGALLREAVGPGGARAVWRPLADISPLVAQATIAVEDARFRDHGGIDGAGVVRAAVSNARARRVVSGASTITMQLARLVWPHERSVWGKLEEMVRARRLERALSKRAILEQYLNRAPYGAGAVGVEAASLRVFGKPSAHLSLAEAALIAGLPAAPSRLNPLVNPDGARARQRHVLARMRATGAITAAEHDRALAEPLVYATRTPPLDAMHFTDWVLASRRGGDVRTTLDRGLQRVAERAAAAHVRALATSGATNAAVVVLDNAGCQVRAMVGSADYWAGDGGAVNGALARRQPGSTLKPFTYALAFERGRSPASVVADVETHYGRPDGTRFSPTNFSGKFSGPVLMGDALGRSLNVPAIRVADLVGADALLDRLRLLGVASLDRPAAHYGLGLTLGNGEVTLLELAQAYAALARGGLTCTARAMDDDASGAGASGAGAPDDAPVRAFSEQVSFLVTDVLSDEELRVSAFGPGNALMLGFPVAVKTGTSENWRDSWAVGYTERYTVAVWTGDFGGRSMQHLAGATGAGPLFHAVMTAAAERGRGRGVRGDRPAPEGVVAVQVCAVSGALAGPGCSHRRTVHVQRDHRPRETCDWHRELSIDRRNGLLAGPHCPDEHAERRVFEVLPPAYAAWQAASGADVAPRAYSPLCPADGPIPGSVVITYPRPGEVFVIEPGYDPATQSLRFQAEADAAAERVTWMVDGRVVARAGWPFDADWRLARGTHVVAVRAPGQRGHEVTFEVR